MTDIDVTDALPVDEGPDSASFVMPPSLQRQINEALADARRLARTAIELGDRWRELDNILHVITCEEDGDSSDTYSVADDVSGLCDVYRVLAADYVDVDERVRQIAAEADTSDQDRIAALEGQVAQLRRTLTTLRHLGEGVATIASDPSVCDDPEEATS